MLNQLPPEKKTFINLWKLGISIIFLLIAMIVVTLIQGEKDTANKNHILRMSATEVEPGKTKPDPLQDTQDFTPVNIGIYLDGIETFSIKDSYWMPTFYIWFRWKSDKPMEPGKNFRLVDGKIEKKDLQTSYTGQDGTRYELYKVVARVNKFFNTTRVPLDDHLLNIYIEDASNDARTLRYVADPQSDISSRVKVSGYNITGHSDVVKAHTYKTAYGDPRMKEGQHTTFSEYNYGVTLKRKNFGTRICISKTVYRESGERLILRPLGDMEVKGRKSTIEVFELQGLIDQAT